MNTTPHILRNGNLVQSWSDPALIAAADDWSLVPSIVGYRGDGLAAATGVDPQTITGDDAPGVVDVNASQTNPDGFTTGGVTEFDLADDVVALAGSGTARAPYLVINLDTTDRQDVSVAFNARDLEVTNDATQQLAVQYRVGGTGPWTNVDGGYLADASVSGATGVTPVSVVLPAAASNQGLVQVRIITTDAMGSDEWIGIDDIVVSGQPLGPESQTVRFAAATQSVQQTEGNAGSTAFAYTVERTGGTTGEVTVTVELSSTQADAADFAGAAPLPRTYTVTIPSGQAQATLNVDVAGDAGVEADEAFALQITAVSNADGGIATAVAAGAAAQASGTIVNDDASGTTIGGVRILDAAASLQGQSGTPQANNAISLVRLGAVQAPTGGNYEVVAFDPTTDVLYGLNVVGKTVERFTVTATGALVPAGSIDLSGLPDYGTANSIAVKNGVLAVAYQNASGTAAGRVALYDGTGALQTTVVAGVLPDQVVFSPDGTKLIVTNEGERAGAAGDPNGSLTLIDLSGGVGSATATPITFFSLDGQEAALRAAGIRIAPNVTASQDIEPEYAAFAPDGQTVYVTLQENNAVAVIDISGTSPVIRSILPLGTIDRSLAGNEIDTSDRDGPGTGSSSAGAVSLDTLPIRSLLQPDAIATFQVAGVTYFVTANEGDARSDDSDVARLSTLDLDDAVFGANEAVLKNEDQAGRLNVSTIDGDTDASTPGLEQIVTFGGRGISIFRQNADGTITKVRETGGEFEKIVASQANAAAIFNGQNGGSFDSRSDDKGPEPEGVAVGVVNGRTYAFVSLERVGGVMIYDVTDPANASYVGYRQAAGPLDSAPEVIQFISATDSPTGLPLVITANEVGNALTVYAAVTPIYTIQGTSHQSAFAGQTVTTIGVVTAIDSNGFYMQDALGDGDIRTSDAIFVFTGSDSNAPSVPAGVQVGDRIQVTGAVSEFVPGGSAVQGRGGLTTTQITLPSPGALQNLGPSPESVSTVIVGGAGSRVPPSGALGDASNGSFGPNDPLDPATEATDFWESLEGMVVTVKAGRVVGPTNDFGEVYVVVDDDGDPANGLNTGDPLEPRGVLLVEGGAPDLGNVNIAGGDYNPERIQIDDDPFDRQGNPNGVSKGATTPSVSVGAVLGDVTGVVNYDFGAYEVLAIRPAAGQPAVTVAQASTLQPEVTALVGTATRMTIGTYNVENLDPVVEPSGESDDDVGTGKFDAIARHIVTNMKTPDVVALQEVQDGNGGVNDNLVSAQATLQRLIDAISAAGGPAYAFADNPFIGDDTNGGQPGANIRTAYLYRVDRVELSPNSLRTIDDNGNAYTVRSVNPDGTYDGVAPVNADTAADNAVEFQTNPFFASRLPLVADFTFKPTGETVTVINNHFNSKSNNGPLYGADPSPVNGAELARNAQAQTVNTFVDGLLAANANARVVVVGDLNDFEFEEPLRILEGRASFVDGADADTNREFQEGGAQVLFNLADTAPREDKYSYVFEGNAQSLDHALVTKAVRDGGVGFDSVHVNAEFGDQTSDHDPKVISIELPKAAPVTYKLQILHASDFEAGLNAISRAGNFAAIVDALEDTYTNSITLSSGDGWLPSPFYNAGSDPSLATTYERVYAQYFTQQGIAGVTPSTYDLRAVAGRADITIQNIVGVQAAVFGNHEFDAGTTAIREIIGADLQGAGTTNDRWYGSQFPYLSASLDFSKDDAANGGGLADLFTNDIRDAETFKTNPTSGGSGTGTDKIAPATIIKENGESIGIVGITTQELPFISQPGRVSVIGGSNGQDNLKALADIVNAQVARLKAQDPTLNKVVVLSHLQQIQDEIALAPLLVDVDVLIAGGSNTRLADTQDTLRPGDTRQGDYPIVSQDKNGNPLLIVNTDGEYSYVGRLVLDFDAQGRVITSSVDPNVSGAFATTDATVASLYGGNRDAAFASGTKANLVQQVVEGVDTDNNGTADTNGVADVIRAQDGNTFGRTSVYLDGRRGEVRTEETNLGNLSADANLFAGRKVDATVTVSIKNGGGIRDSIGSFAATGGGTAELPPAPNPEAGKEAGEISQLDIANALRFNNALTLVTLTPEQLLQVLEHGVARVAPGVTAGQFAQVGGVRFSYDATRPAGDRVINAAIVDESGNPTGILARDGKVVASAPDAIRIVTLSFLADGGDGYPINTFIAANPSFADRVDLTTALAGQAGGATFAQAGTEQDALADYLLANFQTSPFAQADTAPSGDTRIQNLAARADTVLKSDAEGGVQGFSNASGWTDNDLYTRELADVNGDGRADVVGFASDGAYVSLGRADGSFAAPALGVNAFSAASGWTDNDRFLREVADVNGDGRADIVGFASDGVYVALGQANGSFAAPALGVNAFSAASGWTDNDLYTRELADVNGDGRADIVGFASDGAYVALGQANGSFAAPALGIKAFGANAGGWTDENRFPRELADVNGDGRADIVGFASDGVYLALGQADGSFDFLQKASNQFGSSADAGGWSDNDRYLRQLSDVNGDGRADIVGFAADRTVVALAGEDWAQAIQGASPMQASSGLDLLA